MSGAQFGRKATLIVAGNGDGLDLSALRFRFIVRQSDQESPNTLTVRVYNLAPDTIRQITGRTPVEYTRVVLQAGYENAAFGVLFDGVIKQFRRGKENAVDSYLDILAAEGDIEYTKGLCAQTVAAGSNAQDRMNAIAGQMGLKKLSTQFTGGVLPRGKVLWGLGRAQMRCEAANLGATWSIQDGAVQVLPLAGYLPGEAVVLSALTGLVGIPEQTEQGVTARCLLNPKLRIGGLVQIDNESVNQTSQADLRASGFPSPSLPGSGQLPYDRYAGVQMLADVATDGFYRLYVAEHFGDTRGKDWYTEITGLAVDKSADKVIAP